MNIGINCQSFVRRKPTGIGRYAYHLVKSLSAEAPGNSYYLYTCKRPFHFRKTLPRFSAANITIRNDYFCRGPAKILGGLDIYHVPSPGGLESPPGAKIIVTVHDVIFRAFPKGHTCETIAAGEREFKEIEEKAAKIICCSRNTVADVQRYFQIPAEKIALVYQGVDKSIFYPVAGPEARQAAKVVESAGLQEKYIFSVGTLEPRKNLVNLFEAVRLLKERRGFRGKLAVAGMKGWMTEDMAALIKKLGLTQDIVFLGYLSNEHLRFFYNQAGVFAFPSFYEGFGFPIVEAFCCGVPVVTSNVSSCPEVAADAAATVAPENPEQIAQAIHQILDDDQLSETLRQRGFIRAAAFDLQKMARETLAVYEGVCG